MRFSSVKYIDRPWQQRQRLSTAGFTLAFAINLLLLLLNTDCSNISGCGFADFFSDFCCVID